MIVDRPLQFQSCHCAAHPIIQIIFMIQIDQQLNLIKATQIEFQSETTGKWISNDLPHKESVGR